MLDLVVSFGFLSLLRALVFTSSPLLVQAQQTPTSAPSPLPNECDLLEAGAVYFTYVRSIEPNTVVMFLLDDIPGNMKLYLTDNAWTGTEFQFDEGTLELTTPADGLAQGSNFGYGPDPLFGNDWVPVEGAFALNPQGEHVFLYCIGSKDVVPLAAISYNGQWQEAGLPSYGFNESSLPDSLATNGTITLEHCDTWEYVGIESGTVDAMKEALTNLDNWKGTGSCAGSSGAALPVAQISYLALALAVGLASVWI